MRDASAVTIIDSKTTRAVANFHCNYIPADDLADLLYTLTVRYLPRCIINIERNGEDLRFKILILKNHSIYSNMYVFLG